MARVTIAETKLQFVSLSPRATTDLIVLHHVGDITRDVTAEEIHQWHLNNGWAGIGYHFVVHKDGSVERGRPVDMIGSHALGSNAHSVGICFVGDFEQESPSEEQIETVAQLLADLSEQYDITLTRDSVKGHREVCETACPGANFTEELLQTVIGKGNFYLVN